MSDEENKPASPNRVQQWLAQFQQTVLTNPKFRSIAMGLVVLAAAYGVFLIVPQPPPGPPLYRFYPQSTSFYLQFNPGEALGKRLLVFLDERARAGGAGQQDFFLTTLLEKFGTTFDSHFSFGIWPARNNFKRSEVLLTFPLKEALALNDLVTRFNWQQDDFTPANYNGVDALIDKDSGSAIAIADNFFLLANTKDTLQTALSANATKELNVFDHPVNKKYLRKLSPFRDGTLIINNTVYAQHALDNREYLPPAMLAKTQKFAKILPVTLAALKLENIQHGATKDTERTYLHVHTVTPLDLKGFDNKEFRKDLRQIYSQTVSFKTPDSMPEDTTLMVAWAGFDKFYDLYTEHLATAKEKGMLKLYGGMLQSQKIDLRKDVVGLLKGEAAIAKRKGSRTPIVILSKTPGKEKTLTQLTQLLATSPLRIEKKEEQFGSISATTLAIPKRNLRVSFGGIGPVIGLGLSPQFSDLVKVRDGELPNLSKNPVFSRMTKSLPDKANAMFYIEWKPSRKDTTARWVDIASGALWATKDGGDADLVSGKFTVRLTK